MGLTARKTPPDTNKLLSASGEVSTTWTSEASCDLTRTMVGANSANSVTSSRRFRADSEDVAQPTIPHAHGCGLRLFLPIPQVDRRHAEQPGRRVVEYRSDDVRQHSCGLHPFELQKPGRNELLAV